MPQDKDESIADVASVAKRRNNAMDKCTDNTRKNEDRHNNRYGHKRTKYHDFIAMSQGNIFYSPDETRSKNMA
jgi:hypothetical protein